MFPFFGGLALFIQFFTESNDMDTLGQRIKQRREALHMTQDELTDAIGLDSASKRTAISRLENNDRQVYSDSLATYAAALQTNVYFLLGLTDNAETTDEEVIAML